MASGRDQTGPGPGLLPAAAGSTGLSGGREHPGDWTVGSPFGGEAVGARGGKDKSGVGPSRALASRCACAHLASLAARARGPYSGGISESYHPTSYSAVSAGCTLEMPVKLFIKSRCRDHSALLNQNLWE